MDSLKKSLTSRISLRSIEGYSGRKENLWKVTSSYFEGPADVGGRAGAGRGCAGGSQAASSILSSSWENKPDFPHLPSHHHPTGVQGGRRGGLDLLGSGGENQEGRMTGGGEERTVVVVKGAGWGCRKNLVVEGTRNRVPGSWRRSGSEEEKRGFGREKEEKRSKTVKTEDGAHGKEKCRWLLCYANEE